MPYNVLSKVVLNKQPKIQMLTTVISLALFASYTKIGYILLYMAIEIGINSIPTLRYLTLLLLMSAVTC